jgi:Ca2+-binding EF-hand superfamily protein
VVEELVGVVSPEVFRAVNNKADGKLTIQDWTNALYIDFQRADINNDGVLSYEELETYIRTSGR